MFYEKACENVFIDGTNEIVPDDVIAGKLAKIFNIPFDKELFRMKYIDKALSRYQYFKD